MALLRAEFGQKEIKRPQITPEQQIELSTAISKIGNELLRTTCELANIPGNIQTISWNEGHRFTLNRAYHLQDDLPEDHEVAVWTAYDSGSVSLLHQVVHWQGEEKDIEVPLNGNQLIVLRERGWGGSRQTTITTLEGLTPESPHEEVMRTVYDVYDTLSFYARAMGQGLPPLPPLTPVSAESA